MGAALEAIFVGLMAFFALGLAYVLLMASWRGAQQLGEGERPDALIIPGLLIVYLLATLLLGKDNPWRRHRRGGE
jgi:hypothetical protein